MLCEAHEHAAVAVCTHTLTRSITTTIAHYTAAPRITCMQEPAHLCSGCGRLRNSLLGRRRVHRFVLPAEDLACRHYALRRRHYFRRSRLGAHRAHPTRVPPEKRFVATTAVSSSGCCCSCGGGSKVLLLLCWEGRKGRQRLGRKAKRQRGVCRAADEEGCADPFGCGKEHSRSRFFVASLVSSSPEQDHAHQRQRGSTSCCCCCCRVTLSRRQIEIMPPFPNGNPGFWMFDFDGHSSSVVPSCIARTQG